MQLIATFFVFGKTLGESYKVTKLLAYALVTGRVILYSNIMNINKLYYNRLYCIKKHNAINFVTSLQYACY